MSEGPGTVEVMYGRGSLPLDLSATGVAWDVLSPADEPAASNPQGDFQKAVRAPFGAPPLASLGRPDARIVIVTSDGTRPVPNRQLIPWVVEEIGVADEQVTVLLGTGSHRPNTPRELEGMFGAELLRRFRIVNHDGFDPEANVTIGAWSDGGEVRVDRLYVEADVRVVLGFIEPHFFAGFSGGAKGVVPGVASIDTILRLHRYSVIAHPQNTWGVLEGNPTQVLVREAVGLAPPHFMVNVALNRKKEITRVFAGDFRAAHDAGCEAVREHSMVPVEQRYPLVVTSVSGYPLDQNVYQAVKAVSVADRICEPGGTIVLVSECSDGLPDHGNFGSILRRGMEPEDLLQWIARQPETVADQWQVQVLATVAARCRIVLVSSLPAGLVRDCMMEPGEELQPAVEREAARLLPGARAALLPEGPLTIPWVRSEAGAAV